MTLYYEQWLRLLDRAEELRALLDENKGKLKLKSSLGDWPYTQSARAATRQTQS